MAERLVAGLPASPGAATGPARVLGVPTEVAAAALEPAEELARARRALVEAAAELDALAERLRGEGRDEEAAIVDTGVLIAGDPGLAADVQAAIEGEGAAAPAALLAAAEGQAAQLAALPDENLAARADDVRSLGRRAARLAAGGAVEGPADSEPTVLVADELGPADVAELSAGTAAVVLARGGATAHAAIVARALGLPMVVGAGEALLDVAPGTPLAVDGDAGTVTVDPAPARAQAAHSDMARRAREAELASTERHLDAVTRDGHAVRVLVNAATAVEARAGLGAGADGAGLVRTELAFLDAAAWPSEAAHRRALDSVLAALRGRTATVRVLDFGGDKTPPFLDGESRRGLPLLLDAPAVLSDQLRAIVAAGRETDLRVMLPMVESPIQLLVARELLRHAATAVDATAPPLGAMIETPRAAAAAHRIALRADFLSIGTNDLSHATLGSDRFGTTTAAAHHPKVLRLIARTVDAARTAGVIVEVCGEAASDPMTLPLLVGLGVDELSVGAARVGTVRRWVRALDHAEARELAQRALDLPDAPAVEALVAEVAERLRSAAEVGQHAGEVVDGLGRPVTLGRQP